MGKIIRVAGIVRKSPTKKNVEDNIQLQIKAIEDYCKYNFKNNFVIEWFIDRNVKGDDPNRPELLKHFSRINEFDFAIAHVSDRYVRHPLGLIWFFDYYVTGDGRQPHNGCKLIIAEGVGSLYKADNTLEGNGFFIFGMLIMKAYSELLDIRRRTSGGIKRLRAELSDEEWKKKFAGRKKGSKNKKKNKKVFK